MHYSQFISNQILEVENEMIASSTSILIDKDNTNSIVEDITNTNNDNEVSPKNFVQRS